MTMRKKQSLEQKIDINASRENWIKIYNQRMELRKEELESEIKNSHSRLSYYGRMIEATQREIFEKESQLKEIKKEIANRGSEDRREEEAKYGVEFDRLLKLPLVKAVEVEDKEIRVFTDTIFIPHENKTYEIGDFLIRIRTDRKIGEKDEVFSALGRLVLLETVHPSEISLDRRRERPFQYRDLKEMTQPLEIMNLRNTCQDQKKLHPHLNAEGHFCFGNLEGMARKLFSKRDYLTLISVILQALQNYNHQSKYADISLWKEVKSERRKNRLSKAT